MATQIKLRRDTAANWALEDPILAQGEPGFDTTNNILKIGDGATGWTLLPSIYDPATNIVPSADNTYDLGSPTKQWRHVYTAGGSIYLDNIKLTNVNGKFVATTVINPGTELEEADPTDSDATSEISGGGGGANTGNIAFDVSGNIAGIYNSTGSGVIISNLSYLTAEAETAWISIPPGNTAESLKVVQEQGDVDIWANGNTWTFDNVGHLVLPSAGALRINNSWTKASTPTLINTDTSNVVWSSTYDYISSVKLTIQLETEEIGDATGWHSQVCEAVIAARGYANGFAGPGGDPVMTVYGVTYTSTVPLATFTVQRNATTKVIELVATRTAATDTNISFRIHSVEMATRD